MGSSGMGGYELPAKMSEEAICMSLLEVKALDIRDVDGGEDPFHYSSGNFGPGYVDVKGTVAAQRVFKPLVEQVAIKTIEEGVEFDHVAGNVTGGVPPAYQFREDYQRLTGRRDIEYVYIRGSRKQGGQGELVTGLQHIPTTRPGGMRSRFLVMEELVNYGETTTNSLLLLRNLGFIAVNAATILYYDHDKARTRLADNNVNLTYLTTLGSLIEAAEVNKVFPQELIDAYNSFRLDPAGWMAERGLENVPHNKS